MMGSSFGFDGGEGIAGFGEGAFTSLPEAFDHVQRGVDRLPQQFKESPRLIKLLSIFLEELQEVEEAIFRIKQQKYIEDAQGTQLDGLGDIAGIQRIGEVSDDIFRPLVKQKIAINASEGQASTLLALWKDLIGSDNATVTEVFPAGVTLFSGVGIPDLSILPTVKQVLPITVNLAVMAVKDPDRPPFCFEGGVGAGFGTLYDDSIGGQFVSITNV